MNHAIEGEDFPPRAGTAGEASPKAAENWIEQWRVVGGGVTIRADGLLNPWRFIPADLDADTRALADRLTADLLTELDDTPGLAAAVRVVISTRASQQIRASLEAMTKGKQ